MAAIPRLSRFEAGQSQGERPAKTGLLACKRLIAFFGGLVIGKARFRPFQRETGKSLRVNEQIRISPVRLIDENNEQIGIVEIDDAKRRAREAGLDLVEVAPTARPPVCRIMDYGKWKYQQRKKEQKAKSHAKQSELKEIRLRPNIDEHDLEIKVNKAREFLEDGDKVQFIMLYRGRQMAHQDLGLRTMEQVVQRLADLSKVEAPPRMQGRRMTMILAPDRKAKQASKPATPSAAQQAPPQGQAAPPLQRQPETASP
ncbi:MAG TPA: translation initiation factor IF-3 [Phycisphaeraceae bacterium]